jgi:hypothetical protein
MPAAVENKAAVCKADTTDRLVEDVADRLIINV